MRRIAFLSLLVSLLAATLLLVGCGNQQSGPRVRAASGQSAMGSVAPPGWGTTPRGFSLPFAPFTVAPTAEMLDGIFVSDFHGLQPFAVAGYTAGFWPDYLGLHAAFLHAHAISIAISARYHAACLDVEPGDATPSQAGAWVLADIKAGFARPCVYGDLSEMPSIRANLAAWLGSNWHARTFLWLAWYRFMPGLVLGYDAVQWTDHALGRNLDETTVSLAFLSIAQPPYLPVVVGPVCFSHHLTPKQCAAAKAKIAYDRGAVASSQRAYDATARRIARLQAQERVFSQRVRWFNADAKRLKTNS